MPLRLIDQVLRRAADAPAAPALVQAGPPAGSPAVVSWDELATAAHSFAAWLSTDVPPGGVVLLCCPNRPEFTVAFMATLAAGARVFPVSPELTDTELATAAGRAAVVAAVGTDAALAALRGHGPFLIPLEDVWRPATDGPPASLPDRGHAHAALLLHSSGTTGLPKIVVRSAASLDAVAASMAEAVGFRPDDRVLAAVPLCHSYGVEHGLLAPVWAGSTVHLCPGFDLPTVTAALESAGGTGATIFPGVPFMYEMLSHHAAGRRFAALRRAYSAGGPLPPAVAAAFRERFGVVVSQLFGATEVGSVTYADPDLEGFDPASVGRAMRGVTVHILDVVEPDVERPLPAGTEGQVAIRADSMLERYLGEESPPTVDGFFLTGDLGRLDGHGNLTITGRLKLLIDVAGLKVNPLEVEAVLAQHPGVAEAVVVPLRVSETVSRLKAVLTATPGAGRPTAEELRRFARQRLAGYKVPRLFEFRDALPRSPAGKVLRHQVEA